MEIRSRWRRVVSANIYGKGSIGQSDMSPLWDHNGLQRATRKGGIAGSRMHGVLLWNASWGIGISKRSSVWFLSVSEPTVDVGEKRREWGHVTPSWKAEDTPLFVAVRGMPCSANPGNSPWLSVVVSEPWVIVSHVARACGNSVSRLGRGRIPVRGPGNNRQWVSGLGSACFLSWSFIFWRLWVTFGPSISIQ